MELLQGEEVLGQWSDLRLSNYRVWIDAAENGEREVVSIPLHRVISTRLSRKNVWGSLLWAVAVFAFFGYRVLESSDTPTQWGIVVAGILTVFPSLYRLWRFGSMFVSISSGGDAIERRALFASDKDRRDALTFLQRVDHMTLVEKRAA